MKRFLILLTFCLFSLSELFAQSPQSFSYQAIARDAEGDLLAGQSIAVKVGILDGPAAGTMVYEETHSVTTNDIGLFSIKVGQGTVISGDFSTIDWGASAKYLDIAIDPAGGSSFTEMGTIQLLSVPYALYAEHSGGDADADPANELQDLQMNGDSLSVSGIDNPTFVDLSSYSDPDDQNLTLTDTELSIEDGNTVDLSGLIKDADADSLNEIQDLQLNGNILTITLSSTPTQIDLSPYLDNTDSQNLENVLSQGSDAGGYNIINLADPVNEMDAVNKLYVDKLLEKIEHLEMLAGVENPVTDYDGNTYNTIRLGNQVWMSENLKVTHYSDGTAIPLIEDGLSWSNLSETDKAYCFYDDDPSNGEIYGLLYTWSAAMNEAVSSNSNPSTIQGVCPVGWHLPSDSEWKEMEMHLGMSQAEADLTGPRGTDEGGKLKEQGTIHWNSPNSGATNSSGFTALPGGYRKNDGSFYNSLNINGYWWCTTENSTHNAIYRSVDFNNAQILRFDYNKNYGYSVRCVKD